eukprot:TRINITY_DN114297_c0_g1_i1.p1 TRINITY_DN114297_c0_g1~~TRINITY_DN114297_c0_g1_i1.p1  ORF type:complete len:207 (-),score=39.38 TRINITY_DN114297_c0_g1_i1:209-808(-)
MAGAAVAVHRRRRGSATPFSSADAKRADAATAEYKHKVHLNKILKAYDKSKTKRLERNELIKLMTNIDTQTPKGTAPSDEEVDYVMKTCDQDESGAIDVDEIGEVLSVWMTYCSTREELAQKLEKYDVSKTGGLSKEELKAYLIDLNGGYQVTDEEVEMVFQQADVLGNGTITKIEIQKATAVWYAHVEHNKSKFCSIL